MKHRPPKLVAFDLDGVLVDTRETHVLALETALATHGFSVSRDALWELDGLSTRQRLDSLSQRGSFPADPWLKDLIDSEKARITDRIIAENGVRSLFNEDVLESLFSELWALGCRMCVVSNARRSTVELCVNGLGTPSKYIDFVIAGDEVFERKPSPWPYLKACREYHLHPSECLAVEDSPRGRAAARAAGCRLFPFETTSTPGEVLELCRSGRYPTTVVVPMAGRGERFARAGYEKPKPLIDVGGKPMVERVLDTLPKEANFVFLVPTPAVPEERSELELVLASIKPNSITLRVNGVTEGAACTVLLAEPEVRRGERLLVANCDQLVDVDWDTVMSMTCRDDGFVLTFDGSGPKWSYAIEDCTRPGYAFSFIEKRQVGRHATCGVYSVTDSGLMFDAIRNMVRADDRTNGEFYLCPALNYVSSCVAASIRMIPTTMVGLGTPEDLESYLEEACRTP